MTAQGHDAQYGWADDRPAEIVPLAALVAGTVLFSGRCLLMGWALVNNGAGSGTATLFDGLDAKGTSIVPLTLAAGGQNVQNLPGKGLYCVQGVFLNVVTATINGSVWVVPAIEHRRRLRPEPPLPLDAAS